ncbi:MAG: large repetitive protein, partial [Pseudonocardiales bacterium]|nr:large repetitive protein [Pseudonocardiales bacterium]
GTVTGKFTFDGSGSTVTGGGVFDHFAFDFGDGTSTTSPAAPPTVTHTYSGDLEPTVTLTAVDANGGSDTDSLTLSPSITIDQVERDPDPPTPGEPLTLHVTVTNGGASTLHGVGVTSTFTPDGVASQSGPSQPAAPDLGAARTTVIDIPADLVGDDAAAEAHVDAHATSTTNAAVDAATRDVSLHLGTGLRVQLNSEVDGSPSERRFTVDATVTNATGEVLHDVTPAALIADPASGTTVGAASPASVTTLEIGQETTFTWTVTLTGSNHSATLDASISGTDGDSTEWTGTASTSITDRIVVNDHGDDSIDEDALGDGRCDVALELDGDQCTLRAAIELVNSLDRTDDPLLTNREAAPITIGFDLAGTARIAPAGPYDIISHPIVLDGTTQPGGFVEVHGNGTGFGLSISGAGSVVRGMVVNGFATGIDLGSRGATVVGNRVGTDATGTTAVPNGVGIQLEDASPAQSTYVIGGTDGTSIDACTGDCNLIAGNTIDINAQGAHDECRFTLQGNWIGLDLTGTHRLSTGQAIFTACSNATAAMQIGGPTPTPGVAPGNRIAAPDGVVLGLPTHIEAAEGGGTVVFEGNTVGLDATGTRSAGAATGGIVVDTGDLPVGRVQIGTAGGGNVISGATIGIDVHTGLVAITGNRIGTDVAGAVAVPNGTGVLDRGQAIHNELVLRDNLVSGNEVGIEGRALHFDRGNVVGLAADGSTALPNGVGVHGVGGSLESTHPEPSIVLGRLAGCTGPCNVIAGNTGAAIKIDTDGGTFESYATYVGVRADGSTSAPNGSGILLATPPGGDLPAFIIGGASSAFTNGTCTGPCNIVAGNHGVGISFDASPGVGGTAVNVIAGNLVGRTANGSAQPNDGSAVAIAGSGSNPTLIGGDETRGNRITAAGGDAAAVVVTGASTPPRVTVRTNRFDGADAADAIARSGEPAPVTLTEWQTAGGVVHVRGFADRVGGDGLVELYAASQCGGDLVPVASAPPTLLGGVDVDVPAAALVGRPFLAALRTDGQGATSEFSTCLAGPAATFTTQHGIVGMTEIDVASNAGFATGDVVEGPGGEQHTVAGFGSLIFAEPLGSDWPIASVIVQVTPAAAGGGPTTTPTTDPDQADPAVAGSELPRTGSDPMQLVLLAMACGIAGSVAELESRRRRSAN